MDKLEELKAAVYAANEVADKVNKAAVAAKNASCNANKVAAAANKAAWVAYDAYDAEFMKQRKIK